MSTALRRALSIAPRAASRVTASPSSLATGARQTRNYAADPNAPPKVPYPWNDPMNPSNWKEEHVRDRLHRASRRPRASSRRQSRGRNTDRSKPRSSARPSTRRLTSILGPRSRAQVVFAVLGGWAVVIYGAKTAFS
jgi:hypothetical protein